MHKQRLDHYCGPAAIQNALEAMGRRLSQKRIAQLCGTSYEGTDEHDIMSGLEALGYGYSRINVNNRQVAKITLTENLRGGSPALLCVTAEDVAWGHWVTIVAPPLGDRFPVVDPQLGRLQMLHWRTLERKWRAAAHAQNHPNERTYYAISVMGEGERK